MAETEAISDRAAGQSVGVGLNAVVVAVTGSVPRVLLAAEGKALAETVGEALPSGPLEAEHRTLEAGLRSWVERQTRQPLGYVEQLYTFGDRARAGSRRFVSIAYLALVGGAGEGDKREPDWPDWYRFFPWEDWRKGRPAAIDAIDEALAAWANAAKAGSMRRSRRERIEDSFAGPGSPFNEERVLERYELMYEAGLVAEAVRDRNGTEAFHPATGRPLALDHRRMLATAIGRLRAKIKYRPVLFELMPAEFTLTDLQRTAEALSGIALHKQNFRRLIEAQGLIEETGALSTKTGGRPAKLYRYRPEITLERPRPGARLPLRAPG